MEDMAGYDCKFVDQVGKEYKCNKCSLVAKKATLTDCCGETFCESCIAGTVDHKEPCPHCGQKQFQLFNQVKYQQHISSLQVFCSVKERGCEWTGRLDQLATHLDPDQNNCQFVDTSCPLCCGTVVPRKKLEEHVTKECVKREHFCQHCSFKASFEEIENQHIPVCKYVPLKCPNRCGVTFEREDMEDHMKMCLKQEISCEFSSAGCEDRFNREDQEKHNRDNIQKHLSMLSRVQQRHRESVEEVVEMKSRELEAQEVKLKTQENKLGEQEKKLKDQQVILETAQNKVKAQEAKLQGQEAERLKSQKDFNVLLNEQNRKVAELERMSTLHEEVSKREHEQLKVRNAELHKIFWNTLFIGSLIVAIFLYQVFSHSHPSFENKIDHLETTIERQLQTFNASLLNKTIVLETKLQQQGQTLNSNLEKTIVVLEKQIEQHLKDIHILQDELQTSNEDLANLTEANSNTQLKMNGLKNILKTVFNRTQNISMFNEFVMRNFSDAQLAGGAWTSPAMYTHVGGYKFMFHVRANGTKHHSRGVHVIFQAVPGEFDEELQWPAKVLFMVQLEGLHKTSDVAAQFIKWRRPRSTSIIRKLWDIKNCDSHLKVYFICHSEVESFLVDNELNFIVNVVAY